MGFGLNLNAGGDYLPVLKYDARAGRLFRMDRDEVTGEQDPVDITEAFEAAVDFAHGEAGWCWFQAGQAPDFVMVPIGEALPPQPTKNHKQGVRLRLLLSSKAAGGKERLRELATTARSALAGLSALHDSWEAGHVVEAPEARHVEAIRHRPYSRQPICALVRPGRRVRTQPANGRDPRRGLGAQGLRRPRHRQMPAGRNVVAGPRTVENYGQEPETWK